MGAPKETPATEPITVLCPECGELIEVKDAAALIRTLHLQNACPSMDQIVARPVA